MNTTDQGAEELGSEKLSIRAKITNVLSRKPGREPKACGLHYIVLVLLLKGQVDSKRIMTEGKSRRRTK